MSGAPEIAERTCSGTTDGTVRADAIGGPAGTRIRPPVPRG
jgi:hypothetical protein